ncbi:cation:proton antiporter [bacterium]|nr:cation:proton antiporter [bacterium]
MIEIVFILGVVLILIKIVGEFFERISLPSVFGEIILGIILGPLLGFIVLSSANGSSGHTALIIKLLGEIGIIFLLFSIGFEKVEMERLIGSVAKSSSVAIVGMIFPFIAGFLIAIIFSTIIFPSSPIKGSLLIGMAASTTSIGISLRTLVDIKYLSTMAGSTILISSILDSFVSLIILSVVVGIIQTGDVSLYHIIVIFFKIGIFALLIFIAHKYIFPILAQLIDRTLVEEANFAIIIGMLFILSYLTERIGLSTIVGSFLFGMAISTIPRLKTETITYRIRGISNGFFIPFFFFNVGLLFDFKNISGVGMFGVGLIFSIILSQIIGGFIGAKIAKFNFRDSLIIGTALIPRNELTLVVASLGLSWKILTKDIFSVMVLLVIISILVTPLMLRLVVDRKKGTLNGVMKEY